MKNLLLFFISIFDSKFKYNLNNKMCVKILDPQGSIQGFISK